jgi:hypothetical protein
MSQPEFIQRFRYNHIVRDQNGEFVEEFHTFDHGQPLELPNHEASAPLGSVLHTALRESRLAISDAIQQAISSGWDRPSAILRNMAARLMERAFNYDQEEEESGTPITPEAQALEHERWVEAQQVALRERSESIRLLLESGNGSQRSTAMINNFIQQYGLSRDTPLSDLTPEQRVALLTAATRNIYRESQTRLHPGTVYTSDEPEYVGRIPVRTELPVTPPGVTPEGMREAVASEYEAHRRYIKRTQPTDDVPKAPLAPTQWERLNKDE